MRKTLILILILNSMIFTSVVAATLPGYENYKYLRPIEMLGLDGTLILSNSPETIKEKGILYRDYLQGAGRLVFHHVNATGCNEQRLVIIVKNPTVYKQRFEVHKEGYSLPHYHYLEAGNNLLNDYYESMTSRIFFLNPMEEIILYDSSPYMWREQMVLSGMLDVYASNRLEVIFAMIGKDDNINELSALKELERDLAPRGTFPCLTKYQYIVLPKAQNAYFLIEDEKSDWLRGVDHLTGKCAINYGNYGIVYKIKLIAQEEMTVFICPRGGIFQGTVRWDNGQRAFIVREHVFKKQKERIHIGMIKKDEIRTLEYILPNGSAAPILLGFDINE